MKFLQPSGCNLKVTFVASVWKIEFIKFTQFYNFSIVFQSTNYIRNESTTAIY